MTFHQSEDERLRELLRQSALLLDWSQSFAKGRPGTDERIKMIDQLLVRFTTPSRSTLGPKRTSS